MFSGTEMTAKKGGMVLPFQPLSLAFCHINYYVDMPAVCTVFLNIKASMHPKQKHKYCLICLLGNEGSRANSGSFAATKRC